MDGSTRVSDRAEICEAFGASGSDLFAFLCSSRAIRLGISVHTSEVAMIVYNSDLSSNTMVPYEADRV